MALTQAQLQAQLDAIDTAIGIGATSVQHGETRVQYRSIAELRTARGAIEQLIMEIGGDATVRSFPLRSSKGL